MSRPRVIKDNNGVAIVEGTPASSLIKDVNKFFATKPRERMAGESISQPRKIDPRAINTRSPIQRRPQSERTDEERRANLEAFDRLSEERKREMTINTRSPIPVQRRLSKEENAFMERLNKDRLAGIQRTPEEEVALRDEMFKTKDPLPRDTVYRDLEDSPMRPKPERRDTVYREGESPLRRRNQAKDKAESRRKRFFQRRRSRKEAERSQKEQEATQGKFITTLGR